MGTYSAEFKVGIFSIVASLLLAFFWLNTRDAPFRPGEAYSIFTIVPSAEGIQFGSIVQMAGVRIGRVGKIDLTADGKARIELELQQEVKLPLDSKATVKTMGMLGDRLIHVLPGVADGILMAGQEITFTSNPGDFDVLTQKVNDVTADTKIITEDLKAITSRLKDASVQGEGWLQVLIGDTQNQEMQKLLTSLNSLTTRLDRLGETSTSKVEELLENTRDVSRNLKQLLDENKNVVEESGQKVTEQLRALQDATSKLNEVLEGVNKIVARTERGEGTIGALLNDASTVESINETLAGANEILERVNRFQTLVDIHGDYYALGGSNVVGGVKSTVGITLKGREDYYYQLGLVSDPVPDATTEVTEYSDNTGASVVTAEKVVADDYQFSFQLARRWNNLALRLGVTENHGGIGADYFLWKDRAAITVDLYDFSSNTLPQLELKTRIGVYNRIYLTAGLDNVLNRYQAGGINLTVGGGFSFRDDDIKYLFTFLPIP